MNSNSFFAVIDGGIKMVGIYDGHGKVGHMCSASAMGIMLDYLRNKNDVFMSKTINHANEEDILNEIKKAFKYTQQVLRTDF
jgi:serine/threonine protein phosphatase PrpC